MLLATPAPVDFLLAESKPTRKQLRQLGIDHKRLIYKGFPFLITAHFQWRLVTRMRSYVTLEEILDHISRKLLNEKHYKKATKERMKYTINSCSVYVKYDRKKNYFVLLTIISPSERKLYRKKRSVYG